MLLIINCFMRIHLFATFLLFQFQFGIGQTVYKTPSGAKYHTATCRYVKNVSEKLSIQEAKKRGLSPCSQCKPNSSVSSKSSSGNSLGIKSNEANGEKSESTQCKGITKSGNRCKHMTRNKNGYCHQHEPN